MDIIELNDIFPYIVSCTHVNEKNCPPAGTRFEERVVKWYELELILWGEGHIITEGKLIPVRRGDLLFRKPGMVVQGFPPYHSYFAVFDMMYSKEKVSAYAENDYLNYISFSGKNKLLTSQFDIPDIMNISQFSSLEEMFRNLYQYYVSNGRTGQFYLRTFIMQILMSIFNEWNKVKVLRNPSRSILTNYSKIIMVQEYIYANLKKRISLGELAEISGLSPNFLCNIFKRIVGVNIVEYVNECKINSAKKALVSTNMCVKEISLDLGFENESYFYTLFRKIEGMSPSEYRVIHRQISITMHTVGKKE
jgi:AraC-like DNA-binding protein